MMRTLALLNQKGGVGKTSVTLGLASAADAAGHRVLVVDLDPQASATWVLGHDPAEARPTVADVLRGRVRPGSVGDVAVPSTWSPRVDVAPASAGLAELERGTPERLRTALDGLDQHYDAILIDCPPSLANLTTSALTAARHAVIVVEPSSLGLRGIAGVADLVDQVWDTTNRDLDLAGVVLNRVPAISNEAERRVDELGRIVGKRAIWKPAIPQRVVMTQAIGDRRPVHAYGARSAEVSEAFDALWRKARRVVSG